MDTQRQPVRQLTAWSISFYDVEGSIEQFKQTLSDAQEKGWEGIAVCEDSFSDTKYIRYYKDRLETDSEYAARMTKLREEQERSVFEKARLEKKAKEKRRQMYEELKKEFEGGQQ